MPHLMLHMQAVLEMDYFYADVQEDAGRELASMLSWPKRGAGDMFLGCFLRNFIRPGIS